MAPPGRTSRIYICRVDHEHDRIYTENIVEYLTGVGIATDVIELGSNGLRSELQKCLDDPAAAVLGFNHDIDHSWLPSGSFLDEAGRRGVPVVQWLLDHPSVRWAGFHSSTATNSRFLLNSPQQQQYFETYCLPGALTGVTGGVGPNRRSRIDELTEGAFLQRPLACIVPLGLHRVLGIEKTEAAMRPFDRPPGDPALDVLGRARYDLGGSLHSHVLAALARTGADASPRAFHELCGLLEHSVQMFRRLKIFAVAGSYPVLIQSDVTASGLVQGAA